MYFDFLKRDFLSFGKVPGAVLNDGHVSPALRSIQTGCQPSLRQGRTGNRVKEILAVWSQHKREFIVMGGNQEQTLLGETLRDNLDFHR